MFLVNKTGFYQVTVKEVANTIYAISNIEETYYITPIYESVTVGTLVFRFNLFNSYEDALNAYKLLVEEMYSLTLEVKNRMTQEIAYLSNTFYNEEIHNLRNFEITE